MSDPYDLDRFVSAQAPSYDTALTEIRRGAKRSHWMWYIFPQIAGLGRSDMPQRFAIQSIEEARAYLAHPVLGARLRECVSALQDLTNGTAMEVFGEVDAMKLRSSLTLFREADGGGLFAGALERWWHGHPDSATLCLRPGRRARRRKQPWCPIAFERPGSRGLLRRDRMGRRTAVVQRQCRSVGHVVSGDDPAQCREPAASASQGDDRAGYA